MKNKYLIVLFVILLLNTITQGQAAEDSLLGVMKEEMWREFNELQGQEHQPYFIEIAALDLTSASLEASFGNVLSDYSNRSLSFATSMRVGTYEFDNSHTMEDDYMYGGSYGYSYVGSLPQEFNADLIKYNIWKAGIDAYKSTLEVYTYKAQEVDSADLSDVHDFSREKAQVFREPPADKETTHLNKSAWKERLKKYSAYFKGQQGIESAIASLSYSHGRSYLINTENSEIVQNQNLCLLYINILARTTDDEIIPFAIAEYAFTPAGLPSDSAMMETLAENLKLIHQLKEAPKAEAYTGPAILSAKATGVFFHEIFGHRIEGHRLNDPMNSKTFENKLGTKVLSKSISVYSDPTLDSYEGHDLTGYYLYDDQGVKSQRVLNVEKGILRNFLMSRKPIKGFPNSNGHGRGNLGYLAVSRQSNLIVETHDPETDQELRKKLVNLCKKQDLDYGYFFKTVMGGYTNTMNYQPDVFNIFPIEVYRIYVDGRPDELVRGVNLIGTPLIMFSGIEATGDTYDVFSGVCGAESGLVPVSTLAPSILVNKVETQSQFISTSDKPILPDPEFGNQ